VKEQKNTTKEVARSPVEGAPPGGAMPRREGGVQNELAGQEGLESRGDHCRGQPERGSLGGLSKETGKVSSQEASFTGNSRENNFPLLSQKKGGKKVQYLEENDWDRQLPEARV